MLTSISPIDGRYYRQVRDLSSYYSEFALIRYRVRVEIEYFIALCELPLPQLKDFDRSLFDTLRGIYRDMTEDEAAEVKEIEKTTNHDVKAVEYFIKRRFDALGIDPRYKEFVHFGLTSQDINNTAVPLSLMCSTPSTAWRRNGRTSPCWHIPTDSPPPPPGWARR